MKNNINITTKIKNMHFDFSPDEKTILNKFIHDNEGKEVDIKYKIIDSPEYHQHKYYRGGLLPAIADAAGEYNTCLQHVLLKREFLFTKNNKVEEIPKRYKMNGIFIIPENQFTNDGLAGMPCHLIKGIILVSKRIEKIDGSQHEMMVGYIPSTSDLTYDEMNQYIIKCENRLFVDLNGSLQEKWGKYRESIYKI